jgi:hypothetical protein
MQIPYVHVPLERESLLIKRWSVIQFVRKLMFTCFSLSLSGSLVGSYGLIEPIIVSWTVSIEFTSVILLLDHLCGLVIRVSATDPEVPGSISGLTRFSEM